MNAPNCIGLSSDSVVENTDCEMILPIVPMHTSCAFELSRYMMDGKGSNSPNPQEMGQAEQREQEGLLSNPGVTHCRHSLLLFRDSQSWSRNSILARTIMLTTKEDDNAAATMAFGS